MGGGRPLVGAIGLVGGYVILFALVHPLVGAAATLLAIVPAIVGAATFGLRWGLAISAAAAIATGALWYVFGDAPGSVVLRVGSGAGAVVVFVVAAALGRLRDLEQQAARRLRERDKLLEARSRLEQWLGDVTGQLPIVLLALDQDGRIRRSKGAGLARLGLGDGSLDGSLRLRPLRRCGGPGRGAIGARGRARHRGEHDQRQTSVVQLPTDERR